MLLNINHTAAFCRIMPKADSAVKRTPCPQNKALRDLPRDIAAFLQFVGFQPAFTPKGYGVEPEEIQRQASFLGIQA